VDLIPAFEAQALGAIRNFAGFENQESFRDRPRLLHVTIIQASKDHLCNLQALASRSSQYLTGSLLELYEISRINR
jgi:hypothetical protein